MKACFAFVAGALMMAVLLIAISGQSAFSGSPTLGPKAYLPFVSKSCAQSFPVISPDNLASEQTVADSINARRVAYGLSPVTLMPELTQAARLHSRDMADHNFTGHTGSDGSASGQRMTSACYNWTAWGEIIGWGFGGDTTQTVDWWMNSPPHRSEILNPDFRDLGVGYAYDPNSDWQHYWTVNFGTRTSVTGF